MQLAAPLMGTLSTTTEMMPRPDRAPAVMMEAVGVMGLPVASRPHAPVAALSLHSRKAPDDAGTHDPWPVRSRLPLASCRTVSLLAVRPPHVLTVSPTPGHFST